jgi:hypothetical protein
MHKLLVILTFDKSLIWAHGCCNFFIQGSPLVTFVKTLNASRSDYVNWISNRRWWTSVADLCSNLFTSTGYKCRLYCLGTFYCCWTCMYSFSLIHCVNTWLKSSWRNSNVTRLPIPVVLCFHLAVHWQCPAENKLLRHDQNYLNFSVRILMHSHLCFFGMPTQLRPVIVLAFIHSYGAVILILSWESVWGDSSNNWAWGDNNHCRYWLYRNW